MRKHISPKKGRRFSEEGKKFLKAMTVDPLKFCLDLDVPSHSARYPCITTLSLDLAEYQRKLAYSTNAIYTRHVE
jgi:hypothetical protein